MMVLPDTAKCKPHYRTIEISHANRLRPSWTDSVIKAYPEVAFRLYGRHIVKSIWRHNSAVDRPITMKFGKQMQNIMSITILSSKLKQETEFQFGGRLFSETGSSFISAVDWDISSKFGMLIDFHLLKQRNVTDRQICRGWAVKCYNNNKCAFVNITYVRHLVCVKSLCIFAAYRPTIYGNTVVSKLFYLLHFTTINVKDDVYIKMFYGMVQILMSLAGCIGVTERRTDRHYHTNVRISTLRGKKVWYIIISRISRPTS